MFLSIDGSAAPGAFDARGAIASAVSRLCPPATLLALCVLANSRRVTALQERLGGIEAEMEERRTKRNVAARRLYALSGKSRQRASDNTVAFPVFQKAAP